MPTIVFKPAGCAFKQDELFGEVFTEAPISLNYAFAQGGKLHIHKSKEVNSGVWDALALLTDVPLVVHFNDSDEELLSKPEENWPPVSIDNDAVVVSAGSVLKVHGDRGKKFSDLKVFVDIALGAATAKIPDFVFSEQGKWLIQNILTPQAGLVALHSSGKHAIYNEAFGYDFQGMWVFDSFLAELQEGKRNVFTQQDWEMFCE